jgi:hypothetical protein
VGSEANACQPARHSQPVQMLPLGAGPVPSITQSSAMRWTSFSGARSRKAGLNCSMTVAVWVRPHGPRRCASQQLPGGNGSAARRGRRSPGDVPVPERAAALAHRPPAEPAGAGGSGSHHPAARELHRAWPLPPGPHHRRAAGGVDGANAAGAQRAAPRRRLRPGIPGVTARRRGAPAGPPGAGHESSTATSRTRRWSCGHTASSSPPTGAFELFHEGVDPALLASPVNVFRLALHADGVAPRVRNLPE